MLGDFDVAKNAGKMASKKICEAVKKLLDAKDMINASRLNVADFVDKVDVTVRILFAMFREAKINRQGLKESLLRKMSALERRKMELFLNKLKLLSEDFEDNDEEDQDIDFFADVSRPLQPPLSWEQPAEKSNSEVRLRPAQTVTETSLALQGSGSAAKVRIASVDSAIALFQKIAGGKILAVVQIAPAAMENSPASSMSSEERSRLTAWVPKVASGVNAKKLAVKPKKKQKNRKSKGATHVITGANKGKGANKNKGAEVILKGTLTANGQPKLGCSKCRYTQCSRCKAFVATWERLNAGA